MSELKYIPKSECEDRRLYRIHSRNLMFGVFCAETGEFLGIREKFDRTYVDGEEHWDKGGSVRPTEALPEVLPAEIPNMEPLPGSVCSVCGRDCHYAKWPEGGEREILRDQFGPVMAPGQWEHLDGTRCEKMGGYMKSNDALHRWLLDMEKKYG